MSSKKRFNNVVMAGKQVKRHKPCQKHDCFKNDCSKRGTCDCNFKKPQLKETKLDSDCFLVNSVVGTKTVQKIAEITLPSSLLGTPPIVSIDVTPNLEGITQNARIIKDKVVNIGIVPAVVSVSLSGVPLPVSFPTNIPFQEHTDFPGACPGDTLTETPLEVEGIFTQDGVSMVDPIGGITLIDGVLVKIVLRTTITVTRPVIKDAHGHFCEVNPHRCKKQATPPSFNFPAPNGNGNGGVTP